MITELEQIRYAIEDKAWLAIHNKQNAILVPKEWYDKLSRYIGFGVGVLYFQGPWRVNIIPDPYLTEAEFFYREDFL